MNTDVAAKIHVFTKGSLRKPVGDQVADHVMEQRFSQLENDIKQLSEAVALLIERESSGVR